MLLIPYHNVSERSYRFSGTSASSGPLARLQSLALTCSAVKSKVEAKELSNLASGAKIEQEEEEQGNSPAYTHPQGGVGTGIAEVEEDDYDAE